MKRLMAITCIIGSAWTAAAFTGTPVSVTVRDWTGKTLADVKGVTFDGTFALDARDYMSGDVDYVSAFDGGEVVKTPTHASHASEPTVVWRNIRRALSTEIFVQPYMPFSVSCETGDPFMTKDPNSDRWLFTSTTGTDVKLKSTTSFPLFALGYSVHTPPNDGDFVSELWAPEVHFIDGSWYLYYCAGSDAMRRHFVVKSTTADAAKLGKSESWGTRTRLDTPDGKWSIDGTVFQAGGKLYFVWSGWPGNGNGRQNLYLAEMASPTSFASNASRVLISTPEMSWETVSRSPCTVNEGPAVLKHGNAVVVVYSCNGSWSADYSLAYLTCTNGNYTTAASWKKHDGVVFSKRNSVNGPGHCAFTTDAEGHDFIVYHGNDGSHVGWNKRYIRCQPFAWHGDEPVFGAPRPTGPEPYEGFDVNRDYRRTGIDARTRVVPPVGEKIACAAGETASPSFLENDCFTVAGTYPLAAGQTTSLVLHLKDMTQFVWSDGTTADKTCTFTTDAEAVDPDQQYGPADTAAVTYTWTGGNGDWFEIAHWDTEAAVAYGIPDSAAHATAVVPANAANVTVRDAYAVSMLEMANGGNTLTLTNGSLTVGGAKDAASYVGVRLAPDATGDATLAFAGAGASLDCTHVAVRQHVGATSSASGVVTVRYAVPAANWTVAPLRASGADSKVLFGTNVRFDVDATALGVPAEGVTVTVPLAWGAALDDDGVTPDGVRFVDGVSFADVQTRSTVTCARGATGTLVYANAALSLQVTKSAVPPEESDCRPLVTTGDLRLELLSGAGIDGDGTLVVTNRTGTASTLTLRLGNALEATEALSLWVSATETGRSTGLDARKLSLKAARTVEPAYEPFALKSDEPFRPDVLMVRFADAEFPIAGLEVVRRFKLVPGLVRMRLVRPIADREAMQTFVRGVEALDGVVYAHTVAREQGSRVPNDPGFEGLWGLRNRGQTGVDWMMRKSTGRTGADGALAGAWNRTVGSPAVIVALVDSGIDYNHPDLAANVWTNPGEIPANGIDDDGNGYVDDVHGIDVCNGDGDPMDDHGHGTHVAGTVAAVGDNGTDGVGVCWNVKLMALKYLDKTNWGDGSSAVECFEYALANGANVVSCSWASDVYRPAYRDAIAALGRAGVLVVCAAGNNNRDIDAHPYYPAGYDIDNIISVLATDRRDNRANQFAMSNWGASLVDVGAPGEGIASCARGGGTCLMSGTSMATPFVSGVAALLLSANRTLTPPDIRRIIMETGDPVLPGLCASGRRVNAERALDALGVWMVPEDMKVAGLAAGATRDVRVTFDATACDVGTYEGELRLAGMTGGTGVVQKVRMVVTGGALSVSPAAAVVIEGSSDGTFASATDSFTIDNTSASAHAWRVTVSEDWLLLETDGGMLKGATSMRLPLALDQTALRRLSPGAHTATVAFADLTDDTEITRTIRVYVCKSAVPGTGYVDASRPDDSGDGLSWATAKKTIGAMASALADGSTVRVADGVYAPFDVSFACNLSICSENGAARTFVDGGGMAPCAVLKGFMDVPNRLVGFTVRNGFCPTGAENVDIMPRAAGVTGGVLENCVVSNCVAESGPAALSNPLGAYNCLLVDNAGTTGGLQRGLAVNCTIVRNTGIAASDYAVLSNCIVWANAPTGVSSDSATGHCSLDADPLFVDAANGDWRLQAASPCVDAGVALTSLPATDLAGEPRVTGTAVDLGAYEYAASEPEEPDDPPVSEPNSNYDAAHTILCFGDSLTFGSCSDKVTIDARPNFFDGRLAGTVKEACYPYWLSGMVTNCNVVSQCRHGMYSDTITAWQGGTTVKNARAFVLKSSEAVPVCTNLLFNGTDVGGLGGLTDEDPNRNVVADFGGLLAPTFPLWEKPSVAGGCDSIPDVWGPPGSIAGTMGGWRVRLTGNRGTNMWMCAIDKTAAGGVTIPAGTRFIPDAEGLDLYRNAIQVILCGANDRAQNYQTFLPRIQQSVDLVTSRGSGRYLVMSPHVFVTETWWTGEHAVRFTSAASNRVERAYAARFGRNYLCLRSEMVSRGLKIAVAQGWMPATTDTTTPGKWAATDGTGLLAEDGAHFTTTGYRVLAYLVHEKLAQLGYVEAPKPADPPPPVKSVYYFVGSDAVGKSSFAGSASGAASGWATAEGGTVLKHTVAAGNDYVIPSGTVLRTSSSADFKGDALTLAGTILLKGKPLTLGIPSLVADGGSLTAGDSNQSVTLNGAISIPENKMLGVALFRSDSTAATVTTLAAKLTGEGTLSVGGATVTAVSSVAQTLVLSDAGDFAGTLSAAVLPYAQNFVLKVTGGFGGAVAALPAGTTKAVFNYGGLDAAKGVRIAATTVPNGLATGLVLYGVADATAANLPLMTFPAGTVLDPTAFAVSHAATVDGARTAFANLGVIANADGTQTLAANVSSGGSVAVDGEAVTFDTTTFTDTDKVNSQKTVVFATQPTVGVPTESGTSVTFGGKTVVMQPYYDVSFTATAGGYKMELALNETATPTIADEAEMPAIAVSEADVNVHVANREAGLWYALGAADAPNPPADVWQVGTYVKGADPTAVRTSGETQKFYKVFVRDSEKIKVKR